jgi:hypothetical protein
VTTQRRTQKRFTPPPTSRTSAASNATRRKFLVFVSLVGALTATSALLLALAPDALRPDAVRSLFAVGEPQSLDVLFDTAAPLKAGQWKYIFIHQSRTDSGDALSLAQTPDGCPDHFVIGNGAGCGDGEIQITQRWVQQDRAGTIAGLPPAQPNFISICLVGDFDRERLTPMQQRRLVQLVGVLQQRLGIGRSGVVFSPRGVGEAGVGRQFPVGEVLSQLLP